MSMECLTRSIHTASRANVWDMFGLGDTNTVMIDAASCSMHHLFFASLPQRPCQMITRACLCMSDWLEV